jgi:hypothetical protein
MQYAFPEPHSLAIIRPDEITFIDHAYCLSFLTDAVSMAEG